VVFLLVSINQHWTSNAPALLLAILLGLLLVLNIASFFTLRRSCPCKST
jgi:hypothetical protein